MKILTGNNKPNTKFATNFFSTRMTTFIKAKLKKSDYQTNIDKYRVAAFISCKKVYKNVKNQHD